MSPAPRWPIRGLALFSTMRIGMPFCSKEMASIRPEGPPPTYGIAFIGMITEQRKRNRLTMRTFGLSVAAMVDECREGR